MGPKWWMGVVLAALVAVPASAGPYAAYGGGLDALTIRGPVCQPSTNSFDIVDHPRADIHWVEATSIADPARRNDAYFQDGSIQHFRFKGGGNQMTNPRQAELTDTERPKFVSLGPGGWLIGEIPAITDQAGEDLVVYEGLGIPEPFCIFGAPHPRGPYTFIGHGYGPTRSVFDVPFDLAGDHTKYGGGSAVTWLLILDADLHACEDGRDPRVLPSGRLGCPEDDIDIPEEWDWRNGRTIYPPPQPVIDPRLKAATPSKGEPVEVVRVDGIDRDVANLDSDGDGLRDHDDLCPNDPLWQRQDLDADRVGDGCDPDRDGDGIDNERDACPDDPRDLCLTLDPVGALALGPSWQARGTLHGGDGPKKGEHELLMQPPDRSMSPDIGWFVLAAFVCALLMLIAAVRRR